MKRILDAEQAMVAQRVIDELNACGSAHRAMVVLMSIVAATLNEAGDGGAMSQLAARHWCDALQALVIEGQRGNLSTNEDQGRVLQ